MLFACGGFACRSKAPLIEAATASAAPASQDRGAICADMGAIRACWGSSDGGGTGRGGAERFWLPRPLPRGPAPPDGFRCGGMGNDRTCEDRRRNGGPFACDAERCVQARPRMPDDGEWECVEMEGIVFCHSRGDAAGIAPGPPDIGWLCGARHGTAQGERVCVDLDPDRPSAADPRRCVFDYPSGAAQRVCTRASGPFAGGACGGARSCPRGMSCVSERCLPPGPAPSCWFDKDCEGGTHCRWGTCEEGSP